MRAANGDLFYPDDEHDARWFAEVHEALPVWPDRFPFDIAEPEVRARITFTVEVLASQRIEVTDRNLLLWASDRFGRVTDNGPYLMDVSPFGQPEVRVPVSFGAIQYGPVEWVGGSAPESGRICPTTPPVSDSECEPPTSCFCSATSMPPCSWCEGDGGADPDEESE